MNQKRKPGEVQDPDFSPGKDIDDCLLLLAKTVFDEFARFYNDYLRNRLSKGEILISHDLLIIEEVAYVYISNRIFK